MTLRMIRYAVVGLFSGACIAAASAAELEGVTVPDTASVGGQTLTLNGVGLRTRAFFRVYVAGLYVGSRSTDAQMVLSQPGAKRVSFTLKRNVDAETFAKTFNEGIRERSTPEQVTAMKARMDMFDALILSMQEVKEGDVVLLDFVPATGTTISRNGKAVGDAVPGEDLYRAILGLFVGPKPVQDSLKAGLLGGK